MSEKVNVEARTKKIISDLLALPISEISLEKRFIEDFHIDSLDSVELATALADEFGIEVSEEDGLGLLTVASVVQFVQGAPQRDTSAQLEEPTDDATYFLLGCDAPLGRRRVLITHRDPERWPWLTGEKLEEPPTEPLLATFEMNGDDGDLLEMWKVPLPIMTKRMLQALQVAGVTNVEAFPVILKNVNTQEEIDSYVAFNIVGLGSMADIKEAKANGLVFRPSESLPDIVIHRSLKSTLLESGISTLTFHKI